MAKQGYVTFTAASAPQQVNDAAGGRLAAGFLCRPHRSHFQRRWAGPRSAQLAPPIRLGSAFITKAMINSHHLFSPMPMTRAQGARQKHNRHGRSPPPGDGQDQSFGKSRTRNAPISQRKRPIQITAGCVRASVGAGSRLFAVAAHRGGIGLGNARRPRPKSNTPHHAGEPLRGETLKFIERISASAPRLDRRKKLVQVSRAAFDNCLTGLSPFARRLMRLRTTALPRGRFE